MKFNNKTIYDSLIKLSLDDCLALQFSLLKDEKEIEQWNRSALPWNESEPRYKLMDMLDARIGELNSLTKPSLEEVNAFFEDFNDKLSLLKENNSPLI